MNEKGKQDRADRARAQVPEVYRRDEWPDELSGWTRYCRNCRTTSAIEDCFFGHDDFVCPKCHGQTLDDAVKGVT